MIALNHALTGAVVATAVSRPELALPAALLSHFVIDALPHWNYQVPKALASRPVIIGLDMVLGAVVISVLALFIAETPWLVFAGGILAIAPDLMWAPYILKGQQTPMSGRSLLHRLRRFHSAIQWSETSKGITVEIAWLMAMFGLLVFVAG